MKKVIFLFALMLLSLCAYGTWNTNALLSSSSDCGGAILPGAEPDPHEPAREDNSLPHESSGYCGNTLTSIRPFSAEEGVSFDGDDSVALTDLLRWLDYADEVCRCMPEYVVDTEFGSGYGVNLSKGYVRHGEAQVTLTEEQAGLVRGIIEAHIN